MEVAVARHWGEISSQPISLEAIRGMYMPASHFRVSRNRYAKGVAFCGSAKAGRIYVLSGQCALTVGAWHAGLAPERFSDFPAGSFEFQVTGESEVHLVKVWAIPERFRSVG